MKIFFFSLALLLQLTGVGQNKKQELLLKIQKANDTSKGELLRELSGTYYFSGQKDSAEYYLDQYLNFVLEKNNTKAIGYAYSYKGQMSYYDNNFEKAIQFYKKALDIAEKNNYERLKISILANIGSILTAEGRQLEALNYFKNTLIKCNELKDTPCIINSNSNIGNVYLHLNEFSKAREMLNQSLLYISAYEKNTSLSKIRSQENYNNKLIVQLNFLDLYLKEEKYDTALQFAIRLSKSDHHVTDTVLIARLYKKIASANLGLENYQAAILNTLKVDTLLTNRKKKSLDHFKEIYNIQSEAFARLGQFEKAYESHILFKNASDSFLSNEKIKVIDGIRTKYETEKKDEQITQLKKEKKSQRTIIGLTIGIATIVLGLLALAFRSKKLKEKLLIQKQETERSLMEKKVTSVELLALRAQMNPHFIFNSLNSISNYVLKSNTSKANLYLNKFSNLMRMSLEQSKNLQVNLQDEVRLLEQYLELEKLRFGDGMQYKIDLPNGILEEDIRIPSMVIQPFVENAVKHGIQPNLDKDAIIKIDFKFMQQQLVCTIEDNGPGIKATQIQSSNNPDHHSLGANITQNRIDLINSMQEEKIQIEIIDKIDINASETGTIIKISFPVVGEDLAS
jgi:tetratricopeptide (TPR) repeat protein